MIPFLKSKCEEIGRSKKKHDELNWIMGELREAAVGNMPLKELSGVVENKLIND